MKKLAITISLLAGATVGYTQGVLNWSDYAPASGGLPAFSISIFSGGTGGPGNTSSDLPAGNATYTGTPAGAGLEVGLYLDISAAAVQNDVSSGTPIATDTFTTPNSFPGRWDVSGGFNATDPTLASGTAVFVELAAWSTSSGATSYAQAISQGVAAGTSGPSSGTTVLGGGGAPPATPGTLAGIGLTDFATTIPEPSTIALGVIGASTFLMRLRRKQ